MHNVVMIPKKRWRPVLIFAMETLADANEVRSLFIDWGYLEHSSLKILSSNDVLEVETYWWWPWRKVVTVALTKASS